jgi:hypothetical protein
VTATSLQHIPILREKTPTVLELFKFYDAAHLLAFAQTTLFERDCPGATDALRYWAEQHGYTTTDLPIDGYPRRVTSVSVPGGPTISVQRDSVTL